MKTFGQSQFSTGKEINQIVPGQHSGGKIPIPGFGFQPGRKILFVHAGFSEEVEYYPAPWPNHSIHFYQIIAYGKESEPRKQLVRMYQIDLSRSRRAERYAITGQLHDFIFLD